ncbi:MAG: AGE family epimerase/isomerase [Lachnospiraceae bacterium]|nr:AGE family epimerase/isomerase [Lachnospiraceae bacterium]
MWTEEIKLELTNHIIPFWLSMKDEENGGYYGFLSYDLELNKKADKGCILNSRILWFFSRAYAYFKTEELYDAAEHAYKFLKSAMVDVVNGGVFWSSTYDGLPGDTLKHTYCQAFAIYGLAAYYEISGDKDALDLAYALMDVIENKCRDDNGYLEAFTMEWQPHSNEELSENGVEAKRTMNSLLHCFEAYSELYRVDQNEKVKEKLIEDANLFMKYYYNPEKKRQEVFFDLDYNPLIDLHSYGHDIETAWLMEKGIDLLSDPELEKIMKPAFRAMEEHTYEAAFDGTAFINECENGVDDTKRIWWVECEAIIGFLNRAQHEAKKAGVSLNLETDSLKEEAPETDKYLQAAKTVWEYVRDHIVDKRPGSEWLSEVDKENVPFSKKPIVEEWKCPYHNGRMCLEVLSRLS